jgi:hypothetical protein
MVMDIDRWILGVIGATLGILLMLWLVRRGKAAQRQAKNAPRALAVVTEITKREYEMENAASLIRLSLLVTPPAGGPPYPVEVQWRLGEGQALLSAGRQIVVALVSSGKRQRIELDVRRSAELAVQEAARSANGARRASIDVTGQPTAAADRIGVAMVQPEHWESAWVPSASLSAAPEDDDEPDQPLVLPADVAPALRERVARLPAIEAELFHEYGTGQFDAHGALCELTVEIRRPTGKLRLGGLFSVPLDLWPHLETGCPLTVHVDLADPSVMGIDWSSVQEEHP